jgi:hypothetical protein
MGCPVMAGEREQFSGFGVRSGTSLCFSKPGAERRAFSKRSYRT